MPRLTTKQLSERTWPDFQRFFSQGNGWDHCGCLLFLGRRVPTSVRKWADKRDSALDAQRDLVERGRSHGILVYESGEPVGWCQFGPTDELSVPRKARAAVPGGADWKVTCFCTDPRYRRRGVTAVALDAALRAIGKAGGGVVEAYAAVHASSDDLGHLRDLRLGDPRDPHRRRQRVKPADALARVRDWHIERARLLRTTRGPRTPETQLHIDSEPEVTAVVEGVGPVRVAYGGGNFLHGGTVTLFERAGFRAVQVVPQPPRVRDFWRHPDRVVMRRTV